MEKGLTENIYEMLTNRCNSEKWEGIDESHTFTCQAVILIMYEGHGHNTPHYRLSEQRETWVW